MNSLILNNILKFIGLILFQVLVLNNLEISYYLSPYVYVFAILTLPFQTPQLIIMLIALATGLCIDVFSGTVGLHASAALLVGFLRPFIMRILTPKNGYDTDDKPNVKSMGLYWFLTYVSLQVVLYHIFYGYIEIFSFSNAFRTFGKALASSALAIFIILMLSILFSPARKRN